VVTAHVETMSESKTRTIEDLARGLAGVRVQRGGEVLAARVRVDSRAIEPGDLFVAIPGLKEDGTRFIEDALARGAAGVVTRETAAAPSRGAWITAEDPRRACALLSARAFGNPAQHLQVAGVTGTNGKTTTTFLVRSIAESSGRRAAVIGTLGAFLPSGHVPFERTTPEAPDVQETLALAVEQGAEIAAMEVSSHALDLQRVEGIEFAAAAFLNLSPEHLDWHGTMEAYGRAKTRLFTDLLKQGRGIGGPRAVLNMRDPWAARIREKIDSATFFAVGSEEAEVAAHEVQDSTAGSSFLLRTPSGTVRVELPIPGMHNVENALAAAGLAHVMGFSIDDIARGLSVAAAPPGRFERVHSGTFDAFVDYAHTEDGLERALHVARNIARSRVIVVLGCGGDRDTKKRPGMGRIASQIADVAIFTTDNPRSEDPEDIIRQMLSGVGSNASRVLVVLDRKEALAKACALAREGDLILACGKGHETYQSIRGVNHPFPEREILRDVALAADRRTVA
jgi:UDP-N-acetylmuramoyl-L-alanyl-D-glutamate--2,6-diaminopimelate ligase